LYEFSGRSEGGESSVGAWGRNLGYGGQGVYRYVYGKMDGFSIRCLGD